MRRLIEALALVLSLVLAACAPPTTATPTGAPTAVAGEAATLTPAQTAAVTPATPAMPQGTPSVTETPVETPSAMGTPAGTPLAVNAQEVEQRLSEVQAAVQQARKRISQMSPEERERVQAQIADLLTDGGQMTIQITVATTGLSPAQRKRVNDTLQQMQSTIDSIKQQIGPLTPVATRVPGQTPDAQQIGRELQQLGQQVRSRPQAMSPAEMQQFTDNVSKLFGEFRELAVEVGVALPQMSPEDRQKLTQTLQQMRTSAQEIRAVLATATPSPSPARTSTPTMSPTAGQ